MMEKLTKKGETMVQVAINTIFMKSILIFSYKFKCANIFTFCIRCILIL